MNGVRLWEVVLHGAGNFVGGSRPDLDEFLAALGVGDQTALVLLLHLDCLFLRRLQKLSLGRRGDNIGEGDRDTRTRCPTEPERLELIEGFGDLHFGIPLGKSVDRGTQEFLVDLIVHEGVVRRECLVEQSPPKGGDEGERLSGFPAFGDRPPVRRLGVLNPDLDACLQIQRARVEGHQGFGHTRVRGKLLILYRGVRSALSRQVVDAQHHVLGRCGNRSPVRRRKDVVRGQHQDASLSLSFCRQR